MRPDSVGPVFAGMSEQWATISCGRSRYLIGGQGEPLVLVHGIAASGFSFRFICEELTSRFTVFVPDLMNVGYSDRIRGLDASIPATSRRLAEFLDAVGLQRCAMPGSSHGGSVVMQLAGSAPERFSRLVLVSPANPFADRYNSVAKFYLSFVGRLFMHAVPFFPQKAWDWGIGRMYANPSKMVAGTGIGYARPLRRRGTPKHLLSALQTLTSDIEALGAELARMARVPSLLIWGDKDPVIEIESGYKLQQALGAEMRVIAGVGHLPYEESPAEFNRILLDWLSQESPQ